MYFVYKNGAFRGRYPLGLALAHIHQGSPSFTVAQAISEGWEITTKPRTKGENA